MLAASKSPGGPGLVKTQTAGLHPGSFWFWELDRTLGIAKLLVQMQGHTLRTTTLEKVSLHPSLTLPCFMQLRELFLYSSMGAFPLCDHTEGNIHHPGPERAAKSYLSPSRCLHTQLPGAMQTLTGNLGFTWLSLKILEPTQQRTPMCQQEHFFLWSRMVSIPEENPGDMWEEKLLSLSPSQKWNGKENHGNILAFLYPFLHSSSE